MKLLLDTGVFLWIITDQDELSDNCKLLFSNPENEVYLSVISIWEIIIKYNLQRLPLPEKPQIFIPTQCKLHSIQSLSLQESAVVQLTNLPEYHKDPFDRMLTCQAISHGLTILTPDKHIQQYPVPTIW